MAVFRDSILQATRTIRVRNYRKEIKARKETVAHVNSYFKLNKKDSELLSINTAF